MFKRGIMLFLGCLTAVALSGCVNTRTYVVNKPRVDQEIPGEETKDKPAKTRKMIVVEVVEKDKTMIDVAPAKVSSSQGVATVVVTQSAPQENNFTLPQSNTPVAKAEAGAPAAQTYVVQKDDTLQKISKKFFGSYSKWTKIYDANRDVIKDPNFLRAGVTLKIPALSAAPVEPSVAEGK